VTAPEQGLRVKVRRVATASVVGLTLAQLISLTQTVVLARMLSPFEVGLFAAGSIMMAFLVNLAEGGLRTALIQRQEDVEEATETVFWATLVSGLVMSLLALAAAPLVAHVFDRREAGVIAAAIAPTMLLFALAAVPDGLLQRRFSVKRRLIVGPSVSAAFAVTAIVAAHHGLGAWSLVLGTYAQCAALLLTTWAVCGWRPGRVRASFRLWKEMARYGYPLTIELFVLRIWESLWRVIIDRALGTAALGQFRFGERLARIPFSAVLEVGSYALLPAFSRVAHEPERLRNVFLDALRWMTFGGAAAAGLMLALGEPAVVVLLGDRWRDAGVIAASMAGVGLGAAWSSAAGEAASGAGRTHRALASTLISVVAGLALLLWLVDLGVLSALIGGVSMLLLVRPVVRVSASTLVRVVWPSVLAASVAAAATGALDRTVLQADGRGTLVGLLLLVVATGVFVAIHLAVSTAADAQVRRAVVAVSRRVRGRG
jgi:O-antigen/teichoic acid export membrane protein